MKKENNQNTWKVHNRKSFIKWPHQGHIKKKKNQYHRNHRKIRNKKVINQI